MSDRLWRLIQSCWAHRISARPTAQVVVLTLSSTASTPGENSEGSSLRTATASLNIDDLVQDIPPVTQESDCSSQESEEMELIQEGNGWSALSRPNRGRSYHFEDLG